MCETCTRTGRVVKKVRKKEKDCRRYAIEEWPRPILKAIILESSRAFLTNTSISLGVSPFLSISVSFTHIHTSSFSFSRIMAQTELIAPDKLRDQSLRIHNDTFFRICKIFANYSGSWLLFRFLVQQFLLPHLHNKNNMESLIVFQLSERKREEKERRWRKWKDIRFSY